jgi:uncharacterized protein (DUF983 family)
VPDWKAPETAQAALRGLCPRCGASGLFRGAVSFSAECQTCRLDFSKFNVGDGPAAFLIFIVGGLVMLGAILLELNAHPPFWVHILIWLPLTTLLTIGLLRIVKAALLVLEYRNQAHEGSVEP